MDEGSCVSRLVPQFSVFVASYIGWKNYDDHTTTAVRFWQPIIDSLEPLEVPLQFFLLVTSKPLGYSAALGIIQAELSERGFTCSLGPPMGLSEGLAGWVGGPPSSLICFHLRLA